MAEEPTQFCTCDNSKFCGCGNNAQPHCMYCCLPPDQLTFDAWRAKYPDRDWDRYPQYRHKNA